MKSLYNSFKRIIRPHKGIQDITKPSTFGNWWCQNEGGLEWYTWMYDGRINAHKDLLVFVQNLESNGERIESLLDVGCGLAVGYSEQFSHKRYVGMDLSEKEIQWCKENRTNPNHSYLVGDLIDTIPEEKFDIVFSQGTIDNVYDMDAFISAIVDSSCKWIHITAYRGWFPELSEHKYTWEESTTCNYNDISPQATRRLLMDLGCTNISVKALDMGVRQDNPITHETRIVARVPSK